MYNKRQLLCDCTLGVQPLRMRCMRVDAMRAGLLGTTRLGLSTWPCMTCSKLELLSSRQSDTAFHGGALHGALFWHAVPAKLLLSCHAHLG
jgi:hypothetical protein